MSFECEDFGTVVQGSVTKALREIFGAEKKRHGKSGDRYLKFHSKDFNKLSKIYDLPTEIKVTSVDFKNNTHGKRKSRLTDLTDLTHVERTNGAFPKTGKEPLRGNQTQNIKKKAKNNSKNSSAHYKVVSAPSAPSAKKHLHNLKKSKTDRLNYQKTSKNMAASKKQTNLRVKER